MTIIPSLSPRSCERVATYAQRIKNKPGTARKASPRAAAATAAQSAAPPVAPGELQGLKDELQRVNQQISKIGRESRPGSDAARQTHLPEKQELLRQKVVLESKIRAFSKA